MAMLNNQRVIIQIHPMIIQMWPHLGSYGQQERRTALAIRGLAKGRAVRKGCFL